MKRLSMLGVVAILSPTFAYAHVTVRPRESKPGIEERYTVRVPTPEQPDPGSAAGGASPSSPPSLGSAGVTSLEPDRAGHQQEPVAT